MLISAVDMVFNFMVVGDGQRRIVSIRFGDACDVDMEAETVTFSRNKLTPLSPTNDFEHFVDSTGNFALDRIVMIRESDSAGWTKINGAFFHYPPSITSTITPGSGVISFNNVPQAFQSRLLCIDSDNSAQLFQFNDDNVTMTFEDLENISQ